MRKIQLCVLVLTAIFSTACPKYRPPVDFTNPNSLVNKIDLNQRLKSLQDRYWCYRFNFDYDASKANPCTGTVTGGPEKAKALRNEFLETALPFLDDAYTNYITDLQKGRDRDNFVADVLELGTSAAVGITKGERAIQILGIGLTAFRGGRRSADLNFYKEQTTPILISKMDGNRAKVRATILNREKTDVDTYPIGAAISDIVDYYNAGTMVRAFTELQKDTAALTKQSEDRVLELKGVQLTTPSNQQTTDEANAVLPVLEGISSSLGSTVAAEQAAALKKLQNIYAAMEKDKDIAPLLKVAELTSAETDGGKLLRGLLSMKRKLASDSALQSKINRAIVDHGK